jgi:hypothetical protein
MDQRQLALLAPSFLIAAGILLSTGLAATGSDWLIVVAAVLFGGCILAADLFSARLRGQRQRLSAAALAMCAAFLSICALVGLRNPKDVVLMIPVIGSAAVVPMLSSRRQACR